VPASASRSFLRKLAVGLPANFILFWLVLDGHLASALFLSAVGASMGAFLLMLLERPVIASARAARAGETPRRDPVHELPSYPRPA
jgi:hypothetical protein